MNAAESDGGGMAYGSGGGSDTHLRRYMQREGAVPLDEGTAILTGMHEPEQAINEPYVLVVLDSWLRCTPWKLPGMCRCAL